MSIEPKCELSNHDLAHKVVVLTHELAKTKGQSWTLSIPVNFDKDPDILFIECADRLLTATAQLAAKDAEIERLKKLIEDDLKRQVRLNVPGASEQRQQAAWENYKITHNL